MPYAYLAFPAAALVRAFRRAAFALGVVVTIAVAGQTLALALQPAAPPSGKASGVHHREPGLRNPTNAGYRGLPQRLEAGFAVDAYDLKADLDEWR
ncbi:MAG: hypothetical protein ACKO1J_01130 [Tagaea sp.]